ncbi:hypothetical protein M758_5G046400 [Ceratodon purpureus]|nr:hypothetical protein M758_5G046400 [Ceratodon purpureus]
MCSRMSGWLCAWPLSILSLVTRVYCLHLQEPLPAFEEARWVCFKLDRSSFTQS